MDYKLVTTIQKIENYINNAKLLALDIETLNIAVTLKRHLIRKKLQLQDLVYQFRKEAGFISPSCTKLARMQIVMWFGLGLKKMFYSTKILQL